MRLLVVSIHSLNNLFIHKIFTEDLLPCAMISYGNTVVSKADTTLPLYATYLAMTYLVGFCRRSANLVLWSGI